MIFIGQCVVTVKAIDHTKLSMVRVCSTEREGVSFRYRAGLKIRFGVSLYFHIVIMCTLFCLCDIILPCA